jgi:hypothetical protein
MKQIKIITGCLLISYMLAAQSPDLDSVKLELYKINKVFDSSRYLGFDVHIDYNSDTLFGKFQQEQMDGRYILNNQRLYYKMGATEYIQNDSFVYNIYHDEKMMMMTKDVMASKSNLFPLKEFADSIIAVYGSTYTITLRNEDDSKVIEFTTSNSSLPYQRFAIYYDSVTHYPDKFEMSFMADISFYEIPDSLAAKMRIKAPKNRITMQFLNYGFPSSLEIFDDENYVYFDRVRKRYQPSEKFKGFRFIANGVGDDSGPDDTIESNPPDDH